jgi:ABC-type polysaccharide/polyol phosphate transport system ATPase subunit
MFGYLGSNGAGKTTIRILLDLIRATSGEISVMGERAYLLRAGHPLLARQSASFSRAWSRPP